jgi:hypothetical protein
MFEVSLDPKDSEPLTVAQVAQGMWRFSRDEMAKGTLDALGEQTFTDGKVRKALDGIMRDAPRRLLNIVRSAIGETGLSPQKIKESLARVWRETGRGISSAPDIATALGERGPRETGARSEGAKRAWRARRAKKRESPYDEAHHVSGKPQEALELYRALDRLCLSLKPGAVEKRFLAKCITYGVNARAFCSVHLQQGGLRVWLWLKHNRLDNPPSFARDVANIGHWGTGDLELGISSLSQIEETANLVRMSFDARM